MLILPADYPHNQRGPWRHELAPECLPRLAPTGVPYLSTPKTHERRKVGLPAFLIDELEPLVLGRPRRPGCSLHHSDVRSRSPTGTAASSPRRFHRRGSAIAALRRIATTHSREPHGIAAGADIKVVQTMLGHKDAAMTLNTYAGLFPDRLARDALDAARHISMGSANEPDNRQGDGDSKT